MGRPRLAPKIEKKIMIDEELATKIDLLLYDPLRERAHYGSWTKLINKLLRNWVSEAPLRSKQTEDKLL